MKTSLPDNSLRLFHERLLMKNAFWNLLGAGLPLIAGIVAIPGLVSGMGIPRFGVLTLVWIIIGYFSMFDLGVGRAVTKLIADKLGAGKREDIPELAWTAMGIMGIIGVLGAIIAALISPWLVQNVLKIPPDLKAESLKSFFLLALSIPVVISTTGFRGILEAHQRFGLINAVKIPMGVFNFLGPFFVVKIDSSLVPVLYVLIAGRIVMFAVYFWLCLWTVKGLKRFIFNISMARSLVSFGGWMTISNAISTIMNYMDRLVIGSVVSLAAVAYYATPNEMITKLWIIPASLVGVLFPAIATGMARDREHTISMFEKTMNYMMFFLFPVTMIVVAFAHEGLGLWLGQDFATNSSSILQWLAVGVFINSISHAPFAMLHGVGRPDLTAKLHIVEFPLYFGLLWYLLHVYGVLGAAIAWVIRFTIDTSLLFFITGRLVPDSIPCIRSVVKKMFTILLLVCFSGVINGLIWKLLYISIVAIVYFLIEAINIFQKKNIRRICDHLCVIF